MGKAVIVSSLGDAAYKVRIIKDIDRVDAAKDKCSDGISAAGEAMAQAEQAETNARAVIVAIGEELDAAIVAAAGNSSDATVLSLQKKQNAAADTLETAQHALAQARLKKLAYEKELATYTDVAGTENRELWCADATDDLAPGDEVGTIEINQETTAMLVAPGGEAADDILQPGMANDALATYYNWSILPGVQRHRPTYRLGTIKEIDYDADTCMVCLDDARSSAQNLRINPEGTPCEVQKDGPEGFVNFCKENPDHPACTTNGSTQQPYSADLKATLDEINKRINESNTYAYDSAQYGKLEHWTEMRQYGGTGDCEDFALAKYRACLNAGIPASALKIATGKTTTGTGHAWLEVQTDKGNVALDLNTQAATFSDELPYSARAVQADGTNWSGNGLLLEDVPVEYMQCNAAAFAEDDRVVVHFKDRDWSRPHVIGFEEKPQQCGVCVIHKDGLEYKSSYAVFNNTGISVSPNTIAGDKITGISGHVHFFRRNIEIDVDVFDTSGPTPVTRTEKRKIALYISPLIPGGNTLGYRSDPATVEIETGEEGEFFIFRVAVVAKDIETGSSVVLFRAQSMPGVTMSVRTETGTRYNEAWAFNWNSESFYFFGANGISIGDRPPATGTAYAYRLKLTLSESSALLEKTEEAKRAIRTGRYRCEGVAVSSIGEAYYAWEAEGIKAVNIATGFERTVYQFVWPATSDDDQTENEYLWSFFMSDAAIGFDVGFSMLSFRDYIQAGAMVLSEKLTTHQSGNEVVSALSSSRKDQETMIDYYSGTEILRGPMWSRFLLIPSVASAEKSITTYPLHTIVQDAEHHEDGVSVEQILDFENKSINIFGYHYYSPSATEQNVYQYPCQICLSDINIRPGERIKAIRSINSENDVATTKAIVVLRNGVDVTTALATALGCAPLDIMGIIDVSGIV